MLHVEVIKLIILFVWLSFLFFFYFFLKEIIKCFIFWSNQGFKLVMESKIGIKIDQNDKNGGLVLDTKAGNFQTWFKVLLIPAWYLILIPYSSFLHIYNCSIIFFRGGGKPCNEEANSLTQVFICFFVFFFSFIFVKNNRMESKSLNKISNFTLFFFLQYPTNAYLQLVLILRKYNPPSVDGSKIFFSWFFWIYFRNPEKHRIEKPSLKLFSIKPFYNFFLFYLKANR